MFEDLHMPTISFQVKNRIKSYADTKVLTLADMNVKENKK